MEQNEMMMMMRGKVEWREEEDDMLRHYVNTHGPHHWDNMARNLGIGRSGNSCRQRWFNYLCPEIRRGPFTPEEMLTILNLHHQIGKRWSRIAKELPGRTDNDIKNFWYTQLNKEAKQLNCDVNSEEFHHIMTTRILNSMQAGGTQTTASTHEAVLDPISDEFWDTLGSISDLN